MSAVDLAPSHSPEQDDLDLLGWTQVVSAFSSRRKCISSSSSGAFVLQHLAQKDNACHGTILVTHLAGARGSEALFTNLQINWPCRCESSSSCFRGKGHSSSAFYSLVSGKRSKCLPHKASPAWPLTKVSRGTVECAPHGLPGSSVHGILQAGILEWVAMPFSRGSSKPRDWTQVSCIAGRFFAIWTTREAPRMCKVLSKGFHMENQVLLQKGLRVMRVLFLNIHKIKSACSSVSAVSTQYNPGIYYT